MATHASGRKLEVQRTADSKRVLKDLPRAVAVEAKVFEAAGVLA